MQHVLIVGRGNLFDEGLRELLSQEQIGLDVLSIIYESDIGVLQRLLEWQPSVVVLFEGGPITVSRVFELANKIPGLTRLRVITVLAETSTIEVYEKQKISATERDALLDLIEHHKQDNEDV